MPDRVFLSGSCLDMKGSFRLLRSSHVRSRDKGLLKGILSGVGGCGTDFFSNEFEEKLFLVRSVEKLLGMVIFSGSALTSFGPNS